MKDMVELATNWRLLLAAVLGFGLAPGVILRLMVRSYPKGHSRREELVAELYAMSFVARPFWVAQQMETAIFEGIPARWHARRERPQAVAPDSIALTSLPVGIPVDTDRGVSEEIERLTNLAERSIAALWSHARDGGTPRIQMEARRALHDCLRMAVDGGPAETSMSKSDRMPVAFDRLLKSVASNTHGWVLRLTRRTGRLQCPFGLGAFVMSALAAGSLALGGPHGTALLFLLVAVGLGAVQKAVGRLTGEGPVSLWVVSLLNHVARLLLISGIAWHEQRIGRSLMAAMLLIAGSFGLLGALVQMSTRQFGIGIRWQHSREGAIQTLSISLYLLIHTMTFGMPSQLNSVGVLLLMLAYGTSGLMQVSRATVAMRRSSIQSVTTVVTGLDGEVAFFGQSTRPYVRSSLAGS